jgi:PKHD-type hydroxylase
MNLKHNYYWFKSALSPEDCKKIIELGTTIIADEEAKGHSTEAYTFGDTHKQAMGQDATPLNETLFCDIDNLSDKKLYIRDSKIAWLNNQWIYDLIMPYIHEANFKAGWKWNIDNTEQFQFTQYNSPGGFYGWHKDGFSDENGIYKRYIHGVTETPLKENGNLPSGWTDIPNMVGKVRKISMTINLNAPGEYEGGNLKFDFGMHTDKENRFHECEEIRPQGSMIVFPSFIDHCVTPVTSGTRYSLVLWCLGDPWK